MGYWFPTFNVVGGLYSGVTPSGNLEEFLEHIPNITILGETSGGNQTYTQTPSNPVAGYEWEGAYGSGEGPMRAYGDQHLGEGVQSDVPIMIFQIPNPEGATYYKQEMVVYGSISASRREGGNPSVVPSTHWLNHAYDFIYVTRIIRREYATPTATPVLTHTLYNGSMGSAGLNWLVGGNRNYAGPLVTNFKIGLSYAEINNKNYLCFFMYVKQVDARGVVYPAVEERDYTLYTFAGLSLSLLNSAFGDFKLDENDDPNIDPDPDPDPGQDPTPGPGEREREYDPIPIPGMPDLDAIGVGFITLYTPSKAILNLLADEIFSTNILDIIKNYFASIQELIAGLTILPFFVPSAGYAHHKIGLFESTVAMPVVANQFIEVDCGSVEIKKYFNNFLDYAGNTRIYLWLPYIGYQEINPDEVMGNTISIKYHCDVLSGACVAFVMIGTGGSAAETDRVIAQYSGNVLTQVPVAEQSFNSQVSNAINILTASVGIAAGAAIGGAAVGAAAGTSSTALVPVGAAGAAGSAAGGAAGSLGMGSAERAAMAGVIGSHANKGMSGTSANNVMGKKPTFSRNGTPGSTSGYMSVQKPYLIKIVPRDAVAHNHIHLNGYPSDFGGTLAGLSGYCEIEEIQLNGVSATESEFKEIYNLLKGGVII